LSKKIALSIFLFIVLFIVLMMLFQKISKKENIKHLLEQKLDGRLLPHEVNNQKKLNDILNNGIRSFELDLFFYTDTNHLSYFKIGHDKENLDQLIFETYLKKLKKYKIKKIWMDVKNVSTQNIDKILTRLNYLDKHYNIKPIVIFESALRSDQLRKISYAGFHTSYYLYNNPIHEMLLREDDKGLIKEANTIKQQIEKQEMKAISFNSLLYPFIKDYLEPILSSNIVYHTWKSVKFKNYNAIQKMQEKKYFQDKRIKTILYYYDAKD